MPACAIGIDLGGTKIAGALVAGDGAILAAVRQPTQAEEGVEAVVGRIVACIRALMDRAPSPVVGIGLGAAAMTDSRRGVIIMASNLQWRDVPLRDLVAARLAGFSGPIYVDKDTNAAVLGEMLYGAGRGSAHLLYVTVGTGVGGGMVLDGRLYHGASEGASDIGHLVLEPDGPPCGCGKQGCLETLASGTAIARQAREALRGGAQSSLRAFDPDSVTAVQVVEAARDGDDLARAIVIRAGEYLGIGLAYYVDINNPERIIVGGGVAAAGPLLLDPLRRVLARRALPANVQAVQVVPAGLGEHAGEVGAAALVWHRAGGQAA